MRETGRHYGAQISRQILTLKGIDFMRAVLAIFFLVAAANAARSADMEAGSYECWYFSQAQLMLNFTVDGPGAYTGYDGTTGAYSIDALGAVTFLSGPLQGVMPDGFVASYEVRQGIPTLSYISGRGAEAAFCQRG